MEHSHQKTRRKTPHRRTRKVLKEPRVPKHHLSSNLTPTEGSKCPQEVFSQSKDTSSADTLSQAEGLPAEPNIDIEIALLKRSSEDGFCIRNNIGLQIPQLAI